MKNFTPGFVDLLCGTNALFIFFSYVWQRSEFTFGFGRVWKKFSCFLSVFLEYFERSSTIIMNPKQSMLFNEIKRHLFLYSLWFDSLFIFFYYFSFNSFNEANLKTKKKEDWKKTLFFQRQPRHTQSHRSLRKSINFVYHF